MPIDANWSRHVWVRPVSGIGCTCGIAASGHHMRKFPPSKVHLYITDFGRFEGQRSGVER